MKHKSISSSLLSIADDIEENSWFSMNAFLFSLLCLYLNRIGPHLGALCYSILHFSFTGYRSLNKSGMASVR